MTQFADVIAEIESQDTTANDLQALSQTVAKYLPVLRMMRAHLTETASQIETAVVGVCGNFQEMAARTQASVAEASEFLAGGNEGRNAGAAIDKLAQRARSTMQVLLRRSEDAKVASTRALQQMQAIAKATRSIMDALGRLDDISLGNKLLAVNARIQAVNAGKGSGGFNAVASEIASHARESTVIVESIRTLADELNRVAASASSELRVMAETDERSFETSQRDVEDALDEFQRVHNSLEQMMANMTDNSRIVTSEIQGAVRALQFQDRVNQRIAHVVDELKLLCEELQQNCPSNSAERDTALADFAARFTMQDEHHLLTGTDGAAAGGDVELF